LIFSAFQAGLNPTDDVTIAYEASTGSPSNRLGQIITAHQEYIVNSIKQPLAATPLPPLSEIIQEKMEVKKRKTK